MDSTWRNLYRFVGRLVGTHEKNFVGFSLNRKPKKKWSAECIEKHFQCIFFIPCIKCYLLISARFFSVCATSPMSGVKTVWDRWFFETKKNCHYSVTALYVWLRNGEKKQATSCWLRIYLDIFCIVPNYTNTHSCPWRRRRRCFAFINIFVSSFLYLFLCFRFH